MQFFRQIVKLTLFHFLRDVRVDVHGGVEVGVAKDLLDDLDIDAILKQAGREGVAQGVAEEPGQQHRILSFSNCSSLQSRMIRRRALLSVP